MQKLAAFFALEIAAYAVMSNHYHVVLYIDSKTAKTWSDTEVIFRWQELFKASNLAQRFLQSASLDCSEKNKLKELIGLWREQLMDISWFMRCLNESIARQANAEDQLYWPLLGGPFQVSGAIG
ncbi:hypothetical protein [Microbulbifer sp. CnH-101-E]|uniref:hypothetical protein n=1 Tax=unclassified Microbulbifer TaxID=2619833 RepID=UPI0040396CC0